LTAYWWRRYVAVGGEGRSGRRDFKRDDSSKRSGIANKISWDKNNTNRNREQM